MAGLVLALAFALAAPTRGAEGDAEVDSQSPDLERVARELAPGATLRLRGLDLGPGEPSVDLVLERFEVFAPGAKVEVHRRGGSIRRAAPENAYLRGWVDGEPESRAVVTVRARGGIRGLLHRAGGRWVVGGGPAARGPAAGLAARAVGGDELADRSSTFTCGADEMTPPPDVLAGGQTGGGAGLQRSATSYAARIAVETDTEFFQLFGDVPDATDYVGDLFAYVSALYSTEVDTALEVSSISLWAGGTDPWNQGTASCGLYDFGRYWNDNHAGENRTLAHFLSGKPLGGVAWVGVLCRSGFNVNLGGSCPGLAPQTDNYGGAYAFSGGLSGSFDLQNPGIVWDLVVVAHETGHNFRSPHTHCYGDLGGNPSPVDACYAGQCGGTGCYCGSTSLPGGCPGAGQGCGTLMSYCHLLGGGLGNLGWTLGAGHPYGVDPDRVPARMLDHVVTSAAGYPGCLEPSNSAPTAAADLYEVGQYLTLEVAAPGVLANDSDPDGDPLTASLASGPGDGQVELQPDGSFTYSPDPGFTGFDSFDYVASDGLESSPAATVTVEVIACGGSPDLVLSNAVVDSTEHHQACRSITAGPALQVTPTGDLGLEAGAAINLENGFSVDPGGTFSAAISPQP